ncbi:hypothetical protein ATANTOWER_024185 [Ataeniobius toweri]|uniref:Uncharacterized protein n=1 Tax=Ataeniobius toweri TaxID=208326 RepID=A0ABU7AU65_9TELE|nr:hypothetical protein [Ataeniobius toweri]
MKSNILYVFKHFKHCICSVCGCKERRYLTQKKLHIAPICWTCWAGLLLHVFTGICVMNPVQKKRNSESKIAAKMQEIALLHECASDCSTHERAASSLVASPDTYV